MVVMGNGLLFGSPSGSSGGALGDGLWEALRTLPRTATRGWPGWGRSSAKKYGPPAATATSYTRYARGTEATLLGAGLVGGGTLQGGGSFAWA